MKILAILGSPRKGNTYKLVQKIESEMRKYEDDIEFEYLFLKDTQLEQCKGCFTCISKGEQLCPIKDSRSQIEEKMAGSDGVIFASPVYSFNVSALMKNLIDRMSYTSHRPLYFDKYAMAVTSSGGGGIPETLKYLELIIRSWGFKFVNKVGIMTHPAVVPTEKTTKKIENASKEFYLSIKTKKSLPLRLYDLIQFRIMKFNSVESKKYFPADYEFYMGKENYYISTKISIVKNTIARILEKVIIRMIGNNA